jgi:hypothetical protein
MNQIVWNPGMKLVQLETEVIRAAFKFYKGNKTSTASSLGIAIRTLDMKLKKINEEDEAHRIRCEDDKRKREEFILRSRGIPAGGQFDNAATVRA